MKKEYIKPEVNAVCFNAEDIIRTSNAITTARFPRRFFDAVQIDDMKIEIFK